MSVEYKKHLLVDGSNVLHSWPHLRALLRHNRDSARARLSQAVAVLHDAEGLRVSLVFDGRGSELVAEHPSGQATFVHLYTPAGVTADDVIEQLVAKARRPESCLVVTDDRAERQTVEALGAASLSAADLAAWVGQAGERVGTRLASRRRANDKLWRAKDDLP
jgi:predicted RNA-binding protein with PIN domain